MAILRRRGEKGNLKHREDREYREARDVHGEGRGGGGGVAACRLFGRSETVKNGTQAVHSTFLPPPHSRSPHSTAHHARGHAARARVGLRPRSTLHSDFGGDRVGPRLSALGTARNAGQLALSSQHHLSTSRSSCCTPSPGRHGASASSSGATRSCCVASSLRRWSRRSRWCDASRASSAAAGSRQSR